jgi:hypothetical protein
MLAYSNFAIHDSFSARIGCQVYTPSHPLIPARPTTSDL